MNAIEEGTLLWEPGQKWRQQANVSKYMDWLKQHKALDFSHDYTALWNWSVNYVADFWESIWEYFQIQSTAPYDEVLTSHHMPGAKWFTNSKINYAQHIFRNYDAGKTAIIHQSEDSDLRHTSWKQLYKDTIAIQQTLKRFGVEKGDRVVAYAPNIYESIVCFLAASSLGAIWSSASPDFGTQSVIDRFKQIEPKVMITVDGYRYNGKPFERLDVAKSIQAELPTLAGTIAIPYLHQEADFSPLTNHVTWDKAIEDCSAKSLVYTHVEFNEPLWILFSSGTTGKPKPIVHSQGGMLLEHLKALTFHVDLDESDCFFWFTTTGWMMWNFLVGGLLTGSTIILYDGNPAYPEKNRLWQLAEETKMTVLGTSASYITSCMKDDLEPEKSFDLSHLKCIASTGSPLPPEGFQWCYNHVKKDLWIASASGGTDVCTAFILGMPTLPVYAGELQCRGLGAKIESFTEEGHPVIDEVGELVLTEPIPCMPIYFWNDTDGSRMHDSYFSMYEGIWRHGDYLKITDRQSCVIYGRSDATINRGGVRIGTSEIYRAVDYVPDVADSLIVDIPDGNGDSFVPLFVVMKDGCELTQEIKQEIKQQIRTQCSPRHVPTHMYAVPELPKTLNGKKLEIPVKKILQGISVESVVNAGSLSNPDSLKYFLKFAKERQKIQAE
ncbi:acetoacetate--CoA ligase [Virgibacillus halophilus]|uniref:Acetoacetate--CoA ligase n=1 Tax=Tigheibacillus halophilus TaxID=361280 RepID=A0ABU5C8P6_9BACI|nr:acetoacetate--CoA ligase [Virgibacillus halophilus]